ncbi:hypothetical protein J4O75_14945 [Paenibacillus pabuli]
MASGCILGICYICDGQIYEDELGWNDNLMKHKTCRSISELHLENKLLRQQLEDYKKWVLGEEEQS